MSTRTFMAVAAAVAMSAGAATAQTSASTSASSSVTIVNLQEISVSKVRDISFGQVLKPTAGTLTVELAGNGGRQVSGGTGGGLVGEGGQAGLFDVGGEGGRDFVVSLPSTITVRTGAGGANRELTMTPAYALSGTISGQAGEYGSKQIEVTGTLQVPAASETGAYTGQVPVSVAYQ